MLAVLQAKFAAIGALLVVAMGFLAKYFASKAKRATRRAKVAEASVERVVKTVKREQEIDLRYEDLQKDAQEALANDEIPEHLRNPRD